MKEDWKKSSCEELELGVWRTSKGSSWLGGQPYGRSSRNNDLGGNHSLATRRLALYQLIRERDRVQESVLANSSGLSASYEESGLHHGVPRHHWSSAWSSIRSIQTCAAWLVIYRSNRKMFICKLTMITGESAVGKVCTVSVFPSCRADIL